MRPTARDFCRHVRRLYAGRDWKVKLPMASASVPVQYTVVICVADMFLHYLLTCDECDASFIETSLSESAMLST